MPPKESKSANKLIKTYKRRRGRTTTWRAQGLVRLAPNTYKPLDPSLKEIRILEVAPGAENDIVTCTLKHISLLDEWLPVYETISYCWGPPRKPSIIKLNGRSVPVPPSSEAAVRRLRHRDRERVLWIDAICIDQSSLSERSQQVAMMSQIYKLGERNLIYLGEDDLNVAERAAESVHALASEMRAGTDNFAQLYPTMYDTDTGSYIYSAEDFESEIDLEALEVLFDLPWFRRLWVLQEITLARSNTCHWGEVTFQFMDVMRAARWIAFKQDFVYDAILNARGWHCACIMYKEKDPVIKSLGFEPSYLGDLLYTLQICETTEPRDGIYGLLGLLSDEHTLPKDWLWMLEVDYTKTVAAVMCDATRYALLEAGDMRAIQLSVFPRPSTDYDQDFPSWAVRADLQPEPNTTATRLPHFFSANHGLEAPSLLGDVRQGYDILQGQGFIADHVLDTAVCLENRTIKDLHLWLISAKDVARKFSLTKFGGDEELMCTDIALTLTASRSKSGQRAQSNDVTTLADYLLALPPSPADDREAEKIFESVRMDDMKPLIDMMTRLYCMHRRFFITEKGSVGIGPADMKIGDLVVVLRGAELPFILRRLVNYHHVGSAYVHGIMYGEAVKEWQSRNEPETVFCIG